MATDAPQAPEEHADHRAGTLVEYDEFIDSQLRKTRSHVRSVDLAAVLILLLAGSLAFFLSAAVIDHWLVTGGLGFWGRLLLLSSYVVAAGYFVVRQLVPLLIKRINPLYAAYTIERSRPSLQNGLVNFLLFRENPAGVPSRVLEAIEEHAANNLAEVQVETAVDRTRLIRLGYILVGILVASALYALASPKDLFRTVGRVLMPWADISPPTRTTLDEIVPGNVQAFRGQQVTVKARVQGLPAGSKVMLYYTTADRQVVDRAIEMRQPADDYKVVAVLPASDEVLQQSLIYRIEAGDAVTRSYALDVVAAPTIVVKAVEYKYPEYTGLLPQRVELRGDLKAIEGTEVTLEAVANQDIQAAHVDFNCDDQLDLPMRSDKQTAKATFRLSLKEDRQSPEHNAYQLSFKNAQGQRNLQPVRQQIEVTRDVSPELQFVAPTAGEFDLPIDGVAELELVSNDPDFALSKVKLLAQCEKQSVVDVTLLNEAWRGQWVRKHRLEPSKLNLKVGDAVEYWAAAEDSKRPTPNRTETAHRKFRIVAASAPAASAQKAGKNNDGAKGDASVSAPGTDGKPGAGKSGQGDSESPDEVLKNEKAAREQAALEKNAGEAAESAKPATGEKQLGGEASGAGDKAGDPKAGEETGKESGDDTAESTNADSSKSDSAASETGENQAGESEASSPIPTDGSSDGDVFERVLKHREETEAQGAEDSGSSGDTQKSAGELEEAQQPSASKEKQEPAASEKENGAEKQKSSSANKSSPGDSSQSESSKGESSENKSSAGKSGEKSGGDKSGGDKSGSQKSGDDQAAGEQPQAKQGDKTGKQRGVTKEKEKGADELGEQGQGDQGKGKSGKGGSKSGAGGSGKEKNAGQKGGSDKQEGQQSGGGQQGKGSSKSDPNAADSGEKGGKNQPGSKPDKSKEGNGTDQGKKSEGQGSGEKNSSSEKSDSSASESGEQGDSSSGGDKPAGKNDGAKQPGGKQDKQSSAEDGQGKSGQPNPDDKAPGESSAGERQRGEGSSAPGDKEGKQQAGQRDGRSQTTQDNNTGDQQAGEKPAGESSQGQGGQAKDDPTGASGKQPNKSKEQKSNAKGGDGETGKGESGAGQKSDDEHGSPHAQESQQPQSKTQKPGRDDKEAKRDGEEQSPSNSKRESDSEGDEDGDRSGGGKRGGGQKADQAGTGGAGKNTAADEGAGRSEQAGDGETGDRAGDDREAGSKTGKSGEKAGPGSKTRPTDQQSDASASGDKQQSKGQQGQPSGEAGKQASSQGQPGGDNAAGPQTSDSPSGKNRPSQDQKASQQPDAKGEPSNDSPSGQSTDGKNQPSWGPQNGGQPEPGRQGLNANQEQTWTPTPDEADAANLDYARKATDLALTHLKDELEKGDPDQKLLDKLGWSTSDLENFVKRWEQMRNEAKADDSPATRGQLDETLKSLGLRPHGSAVKGSKRGNDRVQGYQESRRTTPPAEHAEAFKAYTQGTARGGK